MQYVSEYFLGKKYIIEACVSESVRSSPVIDFLFSGLFADKFSAYQPSV
jgi:hypothetical protein